MKIDKIESVGFVEGTIINRNGHQEKINFKNAVLLGGRAALVSTLTNNIGSSFNFYISRMIFGDGGVDGSNVIKYINPERTGLFGLTRATKSVIASIPQGVTTQAIFTSVLGFDDANGYGLSEMALVMNNDTLYSMAAFPTLNKTSDIQIVWNWRLNFV